jgi:PAT family beta-lactamase induction signal transducer AmpG
MKGHRPVSFLLKCLLAAKRLDQASATFFYYLPMSQSTISTRSPWSWVPTGYFAEGMPFIMVTWVSATMFKDLGHSDTEITIWMGSLTLMWSLKPLWAAVLDMFKTKKWFVIAMEFSMAVLLAVLAFSLALPNYFLVSIGVLWIMAFASASHDICMDGIYLTYLAKQQQAKFAGIQGVFWNMGKIFCMSAIIYIAGYFGEGEQGSWGIAWCVAAALMSVLAGYHLFRLPTGSISETPQSFREGAATFFDSIIDFFRKPKILGMLSFVLLFRSGEGLLVGVGHLFLQAPLEAGGIGLSLEQKGLIEGLVSTPFSLIGGILGGLIISRYGLKRMLFVMAICLNVPNLTYVYLSQAASLDAQVSLITVGALVSIEKFFYSFGFVANMLYMMQQISPGRYHMVHYAFCSAIMIFALGQTGIVSGFLADKYGYETFFIIVMFATIPSFIVAWFAPFPRSENQ